MLPASEKRLPRVVIVGAPNVGKSTLTNRMCGSRVSIVEPTAGVTRDRVAVRARLSSEGIERWIEVIDTGGIGVVDRDDLGPLVEEQVRRALAGADVVIWVVDVRAGITPLDERVATWVRGLGRPLLLVANKAEGRGRAWDAAEFHRFGISEGPFAISAQNGEGLTELFTRVLELLPRGADALEVPDEPVMKLAVVGQRNAGKSTLINALAREERMIVSEIPGTTRDSVDVVFERGGRSFVAIDTAGLRRKRSIQDAIEFYSDARARRAVRRADVVLLLFDVSRVLSVVDKDLARFCLDHYKPVILGANKWDLAEGRAPEEFRAWIEQELPQLSWAPVSFLSARDGAGVEDTLELAQELFAQARKRVPTAELNKTLQRALDGRVPSSNAHGARVRYATQTDVGPPTFVLFVNDKSLFNKDTVRYLQNRVREELGFPEVPVRIVLRERGGSGEGAE